MRLVKTLLQSRKFIAMIVGFIVIVAAKVFKVDVDPLMVAEIVALISLYILGQGIADNGKEAAKINAVSANAGTTTGASAAVTKMAEEIKQG